MRRCADRLSFTISIHVPREGDDAEVTKYATKSADFYPRPPRGGRLLQLQVACGVFRISIHVPREGDDTMPLENWIELYNFYPRPPRGGRPAVISPFSIASRFLSTSPARGTTQPVRHSRRTGVISIHVPREGDDVPLLVHREIIALFLSTSPARGTTR